MKSIYIKLFIIIIITTFISCNTYPDYKQEFSPSYPIAGDWYVKDYEPGNINFNDSRSSYYNLYIYGTSLEPETHIWVDNNSTTRTGYTGAYRVKTEYNKEALTFNNEKLPFYSLPGATLPDSIVKYITITETSIIENEWPIPDSIFFRVLLYSGEGVELPIDTFYTAGHRFKGTEDPFYDNPYGD